MNLFETIVVAIVEGLTEFLPVSSTGHMIITEKLLGIPDNEYTRMFTVAIQFGAILAVVVLYWRKFLQFSDPHFYFKLAFGVLPALLIGFLLNEQIDRLMGSSLTVALSLLGGGVILLFIDKLFDHPNANEEKEVSYFQAFRIGIWQCLAMIPGVSRSAASIIGGMQQNLSRSAAAEFSFFLAVPTMLAATGYKLFQHFRENRGFTAEEIKLLTVGNLTAFIVAILAIRFFIGFLKKHGFRVWGIYRIIVGLVLLAGIMSGYISK